MKPYDPKKIEAGRLRYEHTQKRILILLAVIINISALVGLFSGQMWLPLGIGRLLNEAFTRVASAVILIFSAWSITRDWRRTVAGNKKLRAEIDKEYGK